MGILHCTFSFLIWQTREKWSEAGEDCRRPAATHSHRCGGGLNQAAVIPSLNPSAWKERCWEPKSTWRPLGAWGSLPLTCTPSSLMDQVIVMKPTHILYISTAYSLHFLNTSIYANYICGVIWIWGGVSWGSLVVVWEHPLPYTSFSWFQII